jgi:hypothetical protein
MDQPPTFPKFSKLPTELRINIWKIAMPEPQSIIIYSRDRSKESMEAEREGNSQDVFTLQDDLSDSEDEFELNSGEKITMPKRFTWPFELCASYKVPALLHTNFEAREIAMKVYKRSFGHQLHQKPVWFDCSRDTLIMASCGALEMFRSGPFILRQDRANFRKDAEDVRFLALTLTDYLEYDHITYRALKHFKNLNALVIAIDSLGVKQELLRWAISRSVDTDHTEIECYVKGLWAKVMYDTAFRIEYPAFHHWYLSEWMGTTYQTSLQQVESLREQAISARISRHLYKLRKQNLPGFDMIYRTVRDGHALFPPHPRIRDWMSKYLPALDLYGFRLR